MLIMYLFSSNWTLLTKCQYLHIMSIYIGHTVVMLLNHTVANHSVEISIANDCCLLSNTLKQCNTISQEVVICE